MNWPTVARPTDLGGEVLLDLEKFARAFTAKVAMARVESVERTLGWLEHTMR